MFGVIALSSVILSVILMTIYHTHKDNAWVTYKIKKGKHYSANLLQRFSLTRLRFHLLSTLTHQMGFNVYFSEQCLYIDHTVDSFDINKAYGVALFNIHKWSARLGWRPDEFGDVELFTYTYQNGERKSRYIMSAKPYDVIRCYITISRDGTIWFAVSKLLDEIDNTYSKTVNISVPPTGVKIKWYQWMFNYIDYPYFGGNLTSPHDLYIKIKKRS